MKTIGILGAGQLGCMLAQSLFRYGCRVHFYDPNPQAPGFFHTPFFTCGRWDEKEKLLSFFSSCDVVTYEFENVSVELLDEISRSSQVSLFPSASILATTQNRLFEKEFLRKQDLPVCDFFPILSIKDLNEINFKIKFPCVIKTVCGGYDGKGQWKLNYEKDLDSFRKMIDEKSITFPLICEEWIPIKKEFSCIVGRNEKGEMINFHLLENIHQNHILHQTHLPAQIPLSIQEKMLEIAKTACEKLNVVGLLTTEFFLSTSEKILVNEFAPRPHNSGHITEVACSFSQFDLLARILCELPLHQPMLFKKHFVMENILGNVFKEEDGENEVFPYLDLSPWKKYPEVLGIRVYGKIKAKAKRKMGHYCVQGETREQVINICQHIRKEWNAESCEVMSRD